MAPRKSGTGTPVLHPGIIAAGSAAAAAYGDGSTGEQVAAMASSTGGRQDGLSAFRYTNLTGVSGALQTKNMSSGFMKEDRNSYWNRRKNNTNEVIKDIRDAKKRKLAMSEEDLTSAAPGDGPLESPRLDVKGKGREIAVCLLAHDISWISS